MKIYHTETQADYDALMVELERQGCKWFSGRKPLETTRWKIYSSETCVKIDKKVISYNEKGYYAIRYPNTPITKYKVKEDEKMKFTKENVGKLFNEHDKYICFSINDLRDEILKLDDTPEKVVVPKFVANYIEQSKKDNDSINQVFAFIDDKENKELWNWLFPSMYEEKRANQEVFMRAWLDGYEVEKEPLYCVNINGQYLVKMIPERNVHKFVEEVNLRIWDPQAYQLTEAEIKEIDERYIPFAVPVND